MSGIASRPHGDVDGEVRSILAEVLGVGERANGWHAGMRLLGGVPEFDSMAVVALVTTIEERFGLQIEDEELRAEVFETLGALTSFVGEKLRR